MEPFMKIKQARHLCILELLAQQDALSVSQLARSLHVSHETIRRDLGQLQIQGEIIRRHGCAKSINQTQDVGITFAQRAKSHISPKDQLAQQALSYIENDMTLALDASSTCWYLARKLPNIPLTVYTNSVRIMETLVRRENIRVIATGGMLSRKYQAYLSDIPHLLALLRSLEIDLFIFSCEGLDSEGVLWDSNDKNARFKALLIKYAAQSLLLMDKSKILRKAGAPICNIEEVDIRLFEHQNAAG
jgi:DeoR family L-fucose operon activator